MVSRTVMEARRAVRHKRKDPFGALEMDSSGVFYQSWWAMRDGFVTAVFAVYGIGA